MSALLERKTNVCQNILMREYLSSRLMLCGCPPTGNFNPIYTNIRGESRKLRRHVG